LECKAVRSRLAAEATAAVVERAQRRAAKAAARAATPVLSIADVEAEQARVGAEAEAAASEARLLVQESLERAEAEAAKRLASE